jgi:hypothetical protein
VPLRTRRPLLEGHVGLQPPHPHPPTPRAVDHTEGNEDAMARWLRATQTTAMPCRRAESKDRHIGLAPRRGRGLRTATETLEAATWPMPPLKIDYNSISIAMKLWSPATCIAWL